MAKLSLDDRLNQIEDKISEKSFRENKGLGNEVGYYIFDYDPREELYVRNHIAYLKDRINNGNKDFRIVEFDLFHLMVEILQEEGYLEAFFDLEKENGFFEMADSLVETLGLDETNELNLIISRILQEDLTDSVVFLTGVGKCHREAYRQRIKEVDSMGGMKVSNMDFIKLLPAFMQDDEAAIALSKAVNKLIGEPGKRLATIRTWDKVDELTEAECNEMAWELDIDWYDSEGMSLTEKRNTIKLAQQIKRKRGTKWAVERLIGAYFGEGYVMEWFEMDDSPYTFAALTTNANTDGENFNKFVDAVQAAKNVRSHIAGVFYYWQQGPDPGIECALNTELHRYDFVKCGTNPRTATIGFVIKPSIETDPEVKPYLYDYTHAGTTTCGTYPQPGTLGAVVKQAAAAEPDTEAFRYNYPECGITPRPGTLGSVIKRAAATNEKAALFCYPFVKCGTKRCGE